MLYSIKLCIMGNEHALCYKTIWFLISLFEVFVFYQIILQIKQMWLRHIIVLSLFLMHPFVLFLQREGYIVFSFLSEWETANGYFIDTSLASLIYFHVGYLCHYYGWLNRFIVPKRFFVFLFSLLLSFIILLTEPYTNYKYNEWAFYIPVFAISMSLCLYLISSFIKGSIWGGFLSQIGYSSLLLLGLHTPIYIVFNFFFSFIEIYVYLQSVIMIVFTIVIVMCSRKFIYKYIPVLRR